MSKKQILYKSARVHPYRGVIRIHARQNDLYEEEDLEALLKACIELNDDRPVRIVMDMSDHDIVLSNSAKAYFHSSELAKKMVIGEAVVTNSTVGSVMFDILLRASRPPLPMRAFKTVEDALVWLESLPEKEVEN